MVVVLLFGIHSYMSYHSVNYADIQRIVNLSNEVYTEIPTSKPVIRIQTWNIKYSRDLDHEPVEETLSQMSPIPPSPKDISFYSQYKQTPWSQRRLGIVNDVKFNSPDIFCVQELMKNQLDDLDLMLQFRWKWFGVARDDGKRDGEYSAIFVKRSVFDVIDSETLWLSETPFEVSKFPGAKLNRIATIVRLKHKISKDKFTIINTHWDLYSDESRMLSANLLRYIGAHEYQRFGYVFLLGDLNSDLEGKRAGGFDLLTGKDIKNRKLIEDPTFNRKFRSRVLKEFKFVDLLELTPVENRMGHLMTVTGWSKPGSTSLRRIDFIMGGVFGDEHDDALKKKFEVLRFKTGENFYDYGVQLSDHRPVIADVVFY